MLRILRSRGSTGLKVVLRPKKTITQVLSSDLKRTPAHFSWSFLIYWSAVTNFKILRELGPGENDVKDSLV